MDYVIIRLPNIIEYEPGETKQLHPYNEFLTSKERFQANGFNLTEEDFETYGLRDVDGNRVSIFPASYHDKYEALERGPQIIARKDLGYIITACSITSESDVLDAGSGSGAMSIYLSSIAQSVTTYDVDEDNVELTRKNAEALDAEVTVNHGDITDEEAVAKDAYDVCTLDIPSPWEALGTATKALRTGGFLAAYTPQATQAQRVVVDSPEHLAHQQTVNVEATEWAVDTNILRPTTQGLQHTGFITVFRHLGE
jgi:tRNA (adenine57-N1/adenine58-N1)-methyltransferase